MAGYAVCREVHTLCMCKSTLSLGDRQGMIGLNAAKARFLEMTELA